MDLNNASPASEEEKEKIKKNSGVHSLFQNPSKNLPLLIVIILLLFLTIIFVQNQQEIRQRAEGGPAVTAGQGQYINTCDLIYYCISNGGQCFRPTPCVSPRLSPSLSPWLSPSLSSNLSPGLSPSLSPNLSPNLSPGASISGTISGQPSISLSKGPSVNTSHGLSASKGPSGSPSKTFGSTCNNKYNLQLNPLKKNFGDPNCDFDKNKLYTLLKQKDPANANKWFYTVLTSTCHGGGFDPNFYEKCIPTATDSCGGYDPTGMWGLFGMGLGRNGAYDHGDVVWTDQVSNAINYNNILHQTGRDFYYWGDCVKAIWGPNAGK